MTTKVKDGCHSFEDGMKIWFQDGKQHREGAPAVTWLNGSEEYWVNGKLHREDGPARSLTEAAIPFKAWYINSCAHRLDGPAFEFENGERRWFYEGEEIKVFSQQEFEEWLKYKSFL